MKEIKEYYYVYIVKNKLNGMFYIGAHSTNNLDDGYIGSGLYLKKAISKEGIENFEKEILEFFPTEEEMWKGEKALLTEKILCNPNCYNIIKGGKRGSGYISKDNQHKFKLKKNRLLLEDYNDEEIE